jgi:hypothetical protein
MSNDNTPGPEPKFVYGCRNGLIIMAVFWLLLLGYCMPH